jgi:hypothetical protein
MLADLTGRSIATIRAAAKRLTGVRRREFQAQVASEYCGGSARRSETVFGWGRETVCTGLGELRSGIQCRGNFSARGRHRTEEKLLHLQEDIRSLVDPQSQVDPKFQSPFAYTRMTAKAVREALIEYKDYASEELPDERTFRRLLNRLGYRMRRVQKAKPLKKNQGNRRHL